MIETEKKLDATIKLLRRHYLLNVIILVVFFILAMFKLTPFFIEKQIVNVTIERYIIVITIIAIPGILKLFAHLLSKVPQGVNIDIAISKYKKAFYTRLYTISSLSLLNIILYDYSGNMNFFWITTVLFLLFIYCKPSFPELERLVKPFEDMGEGNGDYFEKDELDSEQDSVGRELDDAETVQENISSALDNNE
ncbi:MAG: hypothetical protein ITF98_02850 [Fermentimonas sp.]|nr:hypothetical protein [Fermentimonas sp.]